MVTPTDVGGGRSDRNKLKRLGERTAPRSTPFGNALEMSIAATRDLGAGLLQLRPSGKAR